MLAPLLSFLAVSALCAGIPSLLVASAPPAGKTLVPAVGQLSFVGSAAARVVSVGDAPVRSADADNIDRHYRAFVPVVTDAIRGALSVAAVAAARSAFPVLAVAP